ncbi:MAG: hypothetical protein LJE84_12930 [Gammaproteobacteria bacterium]|nr:hypothetical protein [Gammaproteobacteria bacterium]
MAIIDSRLGFGLLLNLAAIPVTLLVLMADFMAFRALLSFDLLGLPDRIPIDLRGSATFLGGVTAIGNWAVVSLWVLGLTHVSGDDIQSQSFFWKAGLVAGGLAIVTLTALMLTNSNPFPADQRTVEVLVCIAVLAPVVPAACLLTWLARPRENGAPGTGQERP